MRPFVRALLITRENRSQRRAHAKVPNFRTETVPAAHTPPVGPSNVFLQSTFHLLPRSQAAIAVTTVTIPPRSRLNGHEPLIRALISGLINTRRADASANRS